jgi:cAMP-dependent protein kinase regulator
MVGGMLETVVRALQKSDLFGALSPEQLRKVAHRGELLQCAGAEIILSKGEPSTAFFLVLSGEVVVIGPSEEEVGRLLPADVVGEMGVLLAKPRTATVRAEGPTIVLRFDAAVFDAMFERIPGFGIAVSRALARRLDDANRKIGI